MHGKENRVLVDKDGRRVLVSNANVIGGIPVKKPVLPTQQAKVVTQPRVVASKPAEVKPVETRPVNSQKPAAKHQKNRKNTKIWYWIIGVLVVAAVAVVFMIILSQSKPHNEDNTNEETPVLTYDTVTEDEEKVTEQTLNDYAEVTFNGYERIETETGTADTIKVTVKNISNEKTNLAIDVVAMDENENILDSSSLYAEGIEPEQVQEFNLFSYSNLTPDQLKTAKYKVYRANTYVVETQSTE